MKTEASHNTDDINHGTFAGLVSYIEEVRKDSLIAPVFKLSDLVSLYTSRLEQLGTYTTGHVHSTKLKNTILSYFPDMTAHQQGRGVVFVCNEDVGAALQKACEHDTDNEAVYLARAARIVRRSMLEMKLMAHLMLRANRNRSQHHFWLLFPWYCMGPTSKCSTITKPCHNQLSQSHSCSCTTVCVGRR